MSGVEKRTALIRDLGSASTSRNVAPTPTYAARAIHVAGSPRPEWVWQRPRWARCAGAMLLPSGYRSPRCIAVFRLLAADDIYQTSPARGWIGQPKPHRPMPQNLSGAGNKYTDCGEFIEKLVVCFQILSSNQIYDQMNHRLFLHRIVLRHQVSWSKIQLLRIS